MTAVAAHIEITVAPTATPRISVVATATVPAAIDFQSIYGGGAETGVELVRLHRPVEAWFCLAVGPDPPHGPW